LTDSYYNALVNRLESITHTIFFRLTMNPPNITVLIRSSFNCLLLLFCSFQLVSSVEGQEIDNRNQLSDLELTIDSLSLLLIEESYEGDKSGILERVNNLLQQASQLEGFYEYAFSNLKAFMILKDDKSKVAIFTSVANMDQGKVYYGGVYLTNSNSWIPLVQEYSDYQEFHQGEYTSEAWYGALYYGIYPFKHKRKEYYVLFGQREVDDLTASKFVDVLVVEEDGILFGLPVFKDESQDDIYNRHFINYAKEAPIKFNYDPLESKIVFDHLIPMRSLYDTSRLVMVPDGSYSAFKFRKGFWIFESMLPVVPMEEAPRSQPVLDSRKNKDILGRPTKKDASNRIPPDSSQ